MKWEMKDVLGVPVVCDLLTNIFGKVAEKATDETARKLAMKGAEKAALQIGSKTGQAIGVRVYDNVRRGHIVGKELQKLLRNDWKSSNICKQFDEIIAMYFFL